MNLNTITGFYGSQHTETTIYTATDRRGGTHYVCEGSKNVNYTFDEVEDGVDIEELNDDDFFYLFI